MPRVHKMKTKRALYSLETLRNAVEELRLGRTLKQVSEHFGIPVSTLSKYRKVRPDDLKSIGAGRKTKLSAEEEQTIVTYLLETGRHGYGLTKHELLKFVREYCEYANIEWNETRGPGEDWFHCFLKRHPELSIRKGETMSSMRVRGADPFVIAAWYKGLLKIFKDEKIDIHSANRVFNCDETGFSHDPKEVKILAAKGQRRVSKNIAGSGKKIHV